ncbi:hypothetical protein F0562_021894 [Nyssa sinensis]|uniref:Uncharacterized protein n=1 Tax=Nyssa sinensis TaxID=561372 RepID=A0A5J5BM38_9ASTE|nr:hypothetical protein F0562_021894 [Nyssa sinensis]
MNSVGTPRLITLKNPNSSHALTRRLLELGFDRSIMGMPGKNMVGLQVLITENCSIAGLAKTTMKNGREDGLSRAYEHKWLDGGDDEFGVTEFRSIRSYCCAGGDDAIGGGVDFYQWWPWPVEKLTEMTVRWRGVFPVVDCQWWG